jgi:hypothetical protein
VGGVCDANTKLVLADRETASRKEQEWCRRREADATAEGAEPVKLARRIGRERRMYSKGRKKLRVRNIDAALSAGPVEVGLKTLDPVAGLPVVAELSAADEPTVAEIEAPWDYTGKKRTPKTAGAGIGASIGDGVVRGTDPTGVGADVPAGPIRGRSSGRCLINWSFDRHIGSGSDRSEADYSNSGKQYTLKATHNQPPWISNICERKHLYKRH